MCVTLSLTDHGIIAVGLPKSVKQKLRSCAKVPMLRKKQDATLRWHKLPAYSNLKQVAPGAILLPSGFLELTTHLLDQTAIPVFISIAEEIMPNPTTAPDREAKLVRQINDQKLIDLVELHRLAIVRHGEAFNVADAVAQLSGDYPAATFAVLVSTHGVADSLVGRMRGLGVACFAATTDFNPPDNARIVVGTMAGLARFSVALEHRDFLIDAEVIANLSEQGKSPLGHAWRARKIGFLRADAKLSSSAEYILRAHYGFREIHLPQHGKIQRDVVVCWQKIVGGPKISRNWWEPVALKSAAYWNNELTCRLAAKFARELSRQLVSTLVSPSGSNLACSERPTRVAVLVENIAQAWKLASFLPDWPIMVAGGSKSDSRVPAFIAQKQTTTFPGTNSIVTLAAVQNVNWSLVDAVVRADGGAGLIPFPADTLAVNASSTVKPLLVVDFNDRRHPQLEHLTWLRNQAYDQAGWFRLGAERHSERIRVFLADHGGRR